MEVGYQNFLENFLILRFIITGLRLGVNEIIYLSLSRKNWLRCDTLYHLLPMPGVK